MPEATPTVLTLILMSFITKATDITSHVYDTDITAILKLILHATNNINKDKCYILLDVVFSFVFLKSNSGAGH